MFQKGDSSNRQQMNGFSIKPVLLQNMILALILTQENAFYQNFQFKTNRKNINFSKITGNDYTFGTFSVLQL